ncbi:MAG: hydroxyethylthiazole kinase [Verrucomicrobiota bacterium]|jgi:hydroxyethylthiazole kinase
MNPKFKAYDLLQKVRRESPVVHHLTNWVTIYDCAQIVKTLGASPVMAHAPEEVVDMARIASALVLNIGTLTVDFVEAMKTAAASANQKGIPVILDVCGAGATAFRDRTVAGLLDGVKINIIKGNASEIARVSGADIRTKGVDATEVGADLEKLAHALAFRRQATVVITGKVDIVAGDLGICCVKNGNALMTHVVGTGCMATSVIGAFAAVESDYRQAAACALACYGIAAELAAEKSSGPASFKAALFDCLYNLDQLAVEKMQRIET